MSAIELLPIHAFLDDRYLLDRGLKNYWGYNTLSFFAPETRYATGNAITDFRSTVAALHDAGIEVILDVVYNHTCEGNQLGPTLCYRGYRQCVLLLAAAGQSALLRRFHRHRQFAQAARIRACFRW